MGLRALHLVGNCRQHDATQHNTTHHNTTLLVIAFSLWQRARTHISISILIYTHMHICMQSGLTHILGRVAPKKGSARDVSPMRSSSPWLCSAWLALARLGFARLWLGSPWRGSGRLCSLGLARRWLGSARLWPGSPWLGSAWNRS